MNSDVMPRRPGWASAMLETYARTADIGILGVKLLYENGSIQHAGMEFRRSSIWGDMWINYHPHKGQTAEGLTGLHEVPAVTAACILIDSSLYRALGGLSEEYIVGDFEDSDLCLRVAAAGRGIWVALDIELYHLERQSQNRVGDGVFRTNLSIYNCWQHQRRWSPAIEGFTQ
jgi:GT2 family glycosyltransferase